MGDSTPAKTKPLPQFDAEEASKDKKYLRKYFVGLDAVLSDSDAVPTGAFKRVLKHLEDAGADPIAPDESDDTFGGYFRTSVLSLLVQSALDRTYADRASVDALLEVVRAVADVVVGSIVAGTHHDDLLKALDPLVTASMKFYTEHGTEADEMVDPTERAQYFLSTGTATAYSYIDPADENDSIFFAAVINILGEAGLFEAILNRVTPGGDDDERPKLASSTLALFFVFVKALEDDLVPTMLKDYVPALCDALMAHLGALTPDEAKTQEIEDLAEALNLAAKLALLLRGDARTELNLRVQQAKLDLALFYIELPFLAPSLRGMAYLQHLMKVAAGDKTENAAFKKAKKKNPMITYYPAAYMSPAAAAAAAAAKRAGASSSAAKAAKDKDAEPAEPTLITIPFLLQWMEEQSLMARVLKAGHPEVVKAGSHILQFIAEHDVLSNDVLDSMWSSVLTGHESMQAKLFEVLLALMKVLPLPQIDYLFEAHISTLEPDRFNNQVLNFVADFTKKAVGRAKAVAKADAKADGSGDDDDEEGDGVPTPAYGLDIFWNILINATTESVIREACSFLQRLLSEFPVHRESFLDKCVANVSAGIVVGTSVTLLLSIFESYTPAALAEALVLLEGRHGLLASAVSRVASASDDDTLASLLKLLEQMVTSSTLEISGDDAVALWDAGHEAGHGPAVVDWFHSLVFASTCVDPYTHERSYAAFSPAVKTALFSARVASLAPSSMSPPEMRMYAAFFRAVNIGSGALVKVSDVLTQTVSFAGLVGEDAVWEVALTNPDPDVAVEALFVLRDLYVNIPGEAPNALRATEPRAAAIAKMLGGVNDPVAGPRMVWLLKELAVATGVPGEPHSLVAGSPAAVMLASDAFEALFAALAEPALMDAVWELLCLLPDEPRLAASVFGLGSKLEPAHDADAAPALFTFHSLYLARMIKTGLGVPGWAQAFVANSGVSYLIEVFTTPALLDPANPAGVYGKRTASLLATLINAVFNAPGLMSTDALAASLNAPFIHNLMSQVEELAAPQPAAPISSALVLSRPKAPTSSRGSLIANCVYSATPQVLSFHIESDGPVQVAAYCIDYNTTRRVQSLVGYMGDDHKVAVPPTGTQHERAIILQGPKFHNGQWVVWNLPCGGQFNVRMSVVDTGGPNWTFSALLLDPVAPDGTGLDTIDVEPAAELAVGTEVFPQVVGVDSGTQGRWRGVYGSGGGVLLGKTHYTAPSADPSMSLGEFSIAKSSKYEWVNRLTSDPRAMQRVDAEDEAAPPARDDKVSEPSAADVEAALAGATRPLGVAAAVATSDEALVSPEDLTGAAGSTAKSLIQMLFASMETGDGALVSAFLDYGAPSVGAWLEATLLYSADPAIRAGVAAGLSDLMAASDAAKATVRGILEELLSAAEAGARDRDPLPVLSEFTQLLVSVETGVSPFPAALFQASLDAVVSAPILEDDDGEVTDTLLGAHLALLDVLLKEHEEAVAAAQAAEFAAFLFDEALFGLPASKDGRALPVCKSPATRGPAFSALLTLTHKASSGVSVMVAKVLAHLKAASMPTGEEWNVDPENPTGTVAAADSYVSSYAARRKAQLAKTTITKYRGLKNQGCTCYLNASLQQMFLIRELRDAILNVPLPQDVSEDDQAKNIMFQLQLLFAHMQESKETFVDTIGFCKTVKMMGEFIRMGQQEDANEFLNGLVDQLEPHLRGTPQEHMFRDVFGGTFMNQIVSKECEHISERPEEYLTISVKVQGKRNLKEGLEFFIQGDMLDGDNKYHCEQCDAKVAANKRCVIQHLPNTLALHLCRFEFSFETFQNVKVNDRFEFPERLNMKPYTREGLAMAEGLPLEEGEVRPDSYYEYQLAGVIIHNGSANAGHYYSYIRERDGDAETAPWYEFNDRRVSSFSKDDMEAKAYGGAYSGMSTHVKSFSGYMLFYERVERFAARVYDSKPLPPPEPVARDPVILEKLWRDGIERAQRRRLLGSPSLGFMWESVLAAPVNMATIELGTRLVFDLLCHCAGVDDIAERVTKLGSLILDSEPATAFEATRWLLGELSSVLCDWLRNVLVKCPIEAVRDAASDLVIAVMERVASDEASGAFEVPAPPEGKAPLVHRFGERVVRVLRLAAYRSPKTTGPLVRVLKAYADASHEARASLVGIGAVKELTQLYMAWKTPVMTRQPRNEDGVENDPPQKPLVELIVRLALGRDEGLELDVNCVNKLFEKAFVAAICSVPPYAGLAAQLVTHWATDNELVTDSVLLGVSSALNAYMDDEVQDTLAGVLKVLLDIDDELAAGRVTKVVSGLIGLLVKNVKLTKAKDLIVKLVLNLAAHSAAVAETLDVSDPLAALINRHGSLRNLLRSDEVNPKFVALFPTLAALLDKSDEEAAAAAAAVDVAALGASVEVIDDSDDSDEVYHIPFDQMVDPDDVDSA